MEGSFRKERPFSFSADDAVVPSHPGKAGRDGDAGLTRLSRDPLMDGGDVGADSGL